MKKLLAPLAISLTLMASSADAQILLEDGFESADMSATNEEGFKWAANNRTSIITKNAAVWNNKQVYNEVTHGNWDVKEGTHALRFRYPAGQEWAEQRFDLGTPERDIWFRFWLRVPVNFDNSKVGAGSNKKFFALWMDNYSNKGDGPTIWWSFWGENEETTILTLTTNSGGYSQSGGHHQAVPFISPKSDRGRWMQIVMHVRAASNSNSSDGVMQFWRRWNGEQEFTKLHEATDLDIAPPANGPDGWKHGYILGWANGAYKQTTEWILDEFVVSRSSLVDDDAENQAAPNPPVLFIEE